MINILVTGSQGFIGRYLVDKLKKNPNFSITEAVRLLNENATNDRKTFQLDLSEPDSITSDKLKGFDVVVHLAALVHGASKRTNKEELLKINVGGTRRLIDESIRAGVKHFIFLSSIGVNGQTSSTAGFTEESICNPNSDYAMSKMIIEDYLRQVSSTANIFHTIIRPPLVYGENAPGNLKLLKKLIQLGVPLPLRQLGNAKSFVSVDNLCDALSLSINRPEAFNKTFLIADDETYSTGDIAIILGQNIGRSARLFSFPKPLIKIALRSIGCGRIYTQLFDSLIVDNSEIKETLCWSPKRSSLAKINSVNSID